MSMTQKKRGTRNNILLEKLEKEFNPSLPIPKYYQLQRIIASRIAGGQLKPGDRLPSTNEIAGHFGITCVTVDKAILALEGENLVSRVQGRGTFVSPPQSRHIGLLLPIEGHVNWDLFISLVESLPKNAYSPFIFNCADSFLEGPQRAGSEERIRQMVLSHPAAIVADGGRFFPFELLAGARRDTRIIFVRRYEPSRPLSYPHATVVPDYMQIGFLGVNHLLNLGHRKMLLLMNDPPDPVVWQCQYRIHAGCRQAIMGCGLRPERTLQVVLYREKTIGEELTAIFSSKRRPTAVVVYQDFYARLLYDILSRLGLKVPEDVAVIGFYNTPWTNMFEVPLTSVSIRPDFIAKETARLITEPGQHEQHILIQPELVIRRSCGAVLEKKEVMKEFRGENRETVEGKG